MFSLISPAKSLDFKTPYVETADSEIKASQPEFLTQASQLVEVLREFSSQDLAQLMKLSDKLASLNTARYQEWQTPFTPDNAKPAVLAFTGDVYTGLDAPSLNSAELNFLQQHLGILSGLYGLLKPLDLMQPYRLEMGTRFAFADYKNLYEFWRASLAPAINQQLEAANTSQLVNLASQEYFKAVDVKQLSADIYTPVFQDYKNGSYKIISFYAKKARGLMVRFIAQNQLTQAEDLKAFDLDGYSFNPSLSEAKTFVFTRKLD